MEPDEYIRKIVCLYRRVDVGIARLEKFHRDRLKCRIGCCSCCLDDITVFEVEACTIQRHYPELLETEKPHPKGKCAFLNSAGVCRIYSHRPYVCRTQGVPLRWVEEIMGEEGGLEIIEYRDICLLNEEDQPVESLSGDKCWTLGPVEAELAGLQERLSGKELRRVALRKLFREKAPG